MYFIPVLTFLVLQIDKEGQTGEERRDVADSLVGDDLGSFTGFTGAGRPAQFTETKSQEGSRYLYSWQCSIVFIFDIFCLDDVSTQDPGLVSYVNASDEGGELQVCFLYFICELNPEGIYHWTYLLSKKGQYAQVLADVDDHDQLNLFCYGVRQTQRPISALKKPFCRQWSPRCRSSGPRPR